MATSIHGTQLKRIAELEALVDEQLKRIADLETQVAASSFSLPADRRLYDEKCERAAELEAYAAKLAAELRKAYADYGAVLDVFERAKQYGAAVPVRNIDGMDWQLIEDVLANEEPHKAVHIFASMLKKRFEEHRPTPAPVAAAKVRSAAGLVDDYLAACSDMERGAIADELAARVALAEQKQPVPPAVAEVLADMRDGRRYKAHTRVEQANDWADRIEAALAGRLEGEAGR